MPERDGPGTKIDDYVCRFDMQAGWVDLTLHEETEQEAEEVARGAMEFLYPLALPNEESSLFRGIVKRALELNEDGPILAAQYFSLGGVKLADLVVDSYGEDGVPRPSPEEVQPLLLQWSNVEIAGEPKVTRVGLAVGETIRVQAGLQRKIFPGFSRRTGEFIKYAVFPPGTEEIIVATVTWRRASRSAEIVQVVDDLMSTMRNIPVDAEGNEIERLS